MGRKTRIVAGASILLAPVLFGVSDQVRMVADPPSSLGAVGEYGVTEATASLASINANRGWFVAASYLAYLGTLLLIPALVAIWRLSVDRAPRWAWAGAALAAMYALGEAVHLAGYNAMSLAFSAHDRPEIAAELMLAMESEPFVFALFIPLVLVGFLSAIPQAIGLRRARVIPLWACLAVIAGTSLSLALGSYPWVTALWTMLVVAGFAPAAIAIMRPQPKGAQPTSAPAAATT
jgi:hypothetical protein